MTGTRALLIGDVIDDIIVVPQGPIRPDTDTTSRITRRPGGSAANTAAWLGRLGVGVDFVGRVGAGDSDRHARELAAAGVTPHLSEDPDRATGTIVVLVEGEHRTMLTDRGANATLDPASVTDALLADAGILHLTGYSLVDALTPRALRELVDRAHAHAVAVSFDPSSVGYIADIGVERFREALVGVDVLRPNLDEGRLLAGLGPEASARAIAHELLALAPVVLLTCGVAGVVVARRGEGSGAHEIDELATGSASVVDPTGAGDAFTAGFLAALLHGADLIDCARAGNESATAAISVVGGRPRHK